MTHRQRERKLSELKELFEEFLDECEEAEELVIELEQEGVVSLVYEAKCPPEPEKKKRWWEGLAPKLELTKEDEGWLRKIKIRV